MRELSVSRFRKRFNTADETTDVWCSDWAADNSRAVWLQGPNGSGKTTLLRCIAGWIVSFEGAIRLDGLPIHTRWAPVQEIALFPAADFLPAGRTLDAVVGSVARNANIETGTFARSVHAERELLGAEAISTQQPEGWSTGERKLLSLALFFALKRPVKLFDEPFAALDDEHRNLLAARIAQDVEAENFVIFTDHREQATLLSRAITLRPSR